MGKEKFGVKKAVSIVLAVLMTVGTLCTNAFAEISVVTSNKTWNMSSHDKTTTNLTSNFDWDDLSIVATEAKVVNFDGTYLVLSGGANTVSFKVAGSCTIKVTAKNNSDKTERGIKLLNSSSTQIGDTLKLPTTTNDTSTTYTYDGNGETLKFAPDGGGISIKSIAITYAEKNYKKGDLNNDGSINDVDASLLMKYVTQNKAFDSTAMENAANANNDTKIDVRDAIWILSNKYEESTESTTIEVIDTSDGMVVGDYEALSNAVKADYKTIYVKPDDTDGDYSINMELVLRLDNGGVTIIGVPDENGRLPVLDFENMGGTGITSSKSGDSDAGIKIASKNNTLKNLVIEKAHDNGILIKGTGVTGNLVENCIVRYNNDSGIQIAAGACGNVLKNVYSYRNCDVFTRANNADGFAIKLSAGPDTTTDTSIMEENKNVCINCYAWENGDDAFDSFDYPKSGQNFANGKWTYWNEYTNCMVWNNGTPLNCMGYNDYIDYAKLDENLPFMMRFKYFYEDSYNKFVTAYNDGTLGSRTMTASTYYSILDSYFPTIKTDEGEISPSEIALSYWGGNPNGFKLGSEFTQTNSLRYLTNCIAFDHEANGVDRNNSGAIIYAKNVISFNNKKNYHLKGYINTEDTNGNTVKEERTYTAMLWENIFGWNGSESDTLPKNGTSPSSTGSAEKETTIREASDRIKKYANNNTVVASNVFDAVFES